MMVAPPFIVLKPGLVVHLVQGPGHWFCLGHPGQPYFFIN
jgi:hypothetical protein